MDIIRLLPDNIANQIAAGEVIQRPANVVKELMENAIDARAKTITVHIVDAGRTLIQVVDDGTGMSETDARMAFERHATSKIQQADDLFNLHTMGFRGEALASIAAVAQVELRTRKGDDELGTRLCLSGGRLTKQEQTACPAGSSFAVQNLFFNTPARRRFLKSDATEMNNIMTAFRRIALVYPQTAFVMRSDETEIVSLRPAGVRQRITDIFGSRINTDLLSVNADTSVCRITGFVAKPAAARKKGAPQFFFVNGRYMRHPYLDKAVANAFQRLIPADCRMPYFIYFDIDPHDIDVNIHPTKTEIKFENEQVIWQILHAATKEAIGRFDDMTAIDFDTQGRPDIPVFTADNSAPRPHVDIDRTYNPFLSDGRNRNGTADGEWMTLMPEPRQKQTDGLRQPESDLFAPDNPTGIPSDTLLNQAPAHYQYKGRYIMTAVKSGLLIIDQHRAHVRILYDSFMQRMNTGRQPSQKLLFPMTVKMTADEADGIERLLPRLAETGFEITADGDGCFIVSGVPALLSDANIDRMLHDMAQTAAEKTDNGDDVDMPGESFAEALALDMARNAAIAYGQVLGNDEMENIVNDLFASENVNTTPDGKTILTILRQSDIDRLF